MRKFIVAVLLCAPACDEGEGGRGGAPAQGGKTDCVGFECEEEGIPSGPLEDAFCDIEVVGHGSVPTETEYLANVIFCENGNADIESLKAMAIAARSVAYWEMGINGDICDDDHCQVFSCEGEPSEIHHRAVEKTSGMYLFWDDEVTYGFYVRGTDELDGLCEPFEPENYVTYNLGRTGENVEQTELGWFADPQDAWYGQNRGCMSQLGMQCLETELDYGYMDILRYYYGADIQVAQARGECVETVDDEPDATSGDEPDSESASASASESESESESDSASESESESESDSASESESESDSDGRPPRPGSSDSASASDTTPDSDTSPDSGSDTSPESDTAAESESSSSTSDTDTDTEGDTEAEAETEADTEADTDDTDGYDPYGSSDGGDWGDDSDAYGSHGGEPSPWGNDSDTDTDTDGAGVESEKSGCSVSPAGGRGEPALALILLLLGTLRRRRVG